MNLPGGAPNYFPNSFSGPVDDRKYALSKTPVVGPNLCVLYGTLVVMRYLLMIGNMPP